MNNDFYSIDKLVEFGMSLAIANQMVSSMNQSMNQMKVPSDGGKLANNVENMYYAVIDGKATGPFSLSDLASLIENKTIVKETYIWKPGMIQWDLAENIEEVLKIVAINPPPIPQS